MEKFLKQVEENLTDLVSPGDKIVVGVSGGADSIALLQVLHLFSKTKNYDLVVAHVNHMARGDESYADAEFVKDTAEKFGLPFFLKEIDVENKKVQFKKSFQEAARLIRYQFFDEILKDVGGNKIALGHSADDRVETILMNIIRGSGLKGLAGIPQVRGNIIRPFWEFYRKDLENYLEENKILFRDDLSNKDSKYLRNRIRHELIPNLESYNPNIKKRLQEMSEIVGEDDALLSRMTRDVFSQKILGHEENEKNIYWKIDDFLSHPVALRQRLVRETFCRIAGNMLHITAHHVREVNDLFNSPKVGKTLNIPRNIKVICSYDTVVFQQTVENARENISEKESLPIPILIPGVTNLTEGQISVETQILEGKREYSLLNPSTQAFLDFEKTGFIIKARFFRPGDRFRPLGVLGNKKLKSFFIDSKIPKHKRQKIPILTNDNDDIIWVYGQRIAHFYRVTNKTKKILFVQGDREINY